MEQYYIQHREIIPAVEMSLFPVNVLKYSSLVRNEPYQHVLKC